VSSEKLVVDRPAKKNPAEAGSWCADRYSCFCSGSALRDAGDRMIGAVGGLPLFADFQGVDCVSVFAGISCVLSEELDSDFVVAWLVIVVSPYCFEPFARVTP